MKETHKKRLEVIAEFSERVQAERVRNRQLEIQIEKLRMEKDLADKEAASFEQETGKVRQQLQKGKEEADQIRRRQLDSEQELDRVRAEMRELREKGETSIRLSLQERESLLKEARDEKDQVQKDFLGLVEKNNQLVRQLEQLEKQQEINLLEFERRNQDIRRESSQVEVRLERKSKRRSNESGGGAEVVGAAQSTSKGTRLRKSEDRPTEAVHFEFGARNHRARNFETFGAARQISCGLYFASKKKLNFGFSGKKLARKVERIQRKGQKTQRKSGRLVA